MMKRFHKLTIKTLLLLVLPAVMSLSITPAALADSGQSGNGQIAGGQIYKIKDETTNGAYATSIQANACDNLSYEVMLYNPGPSFLQNVMVQASLPSNSATSNTSTITASSVNAFPASTSASAVVNFPAAQSVTYQAGTTELLDQNQNLLQNLPDGVTQGGVNIGNLAASTVEFVKFGVKVNCPVVTPPAYACTALGLTAEENRTVKISNFTTSQTGTTFTNATITWGDNSTPLTSASPVGQTHQYAANGTYTVTATANFGPNQTASGPNCTQVVTFSSTAPPTVTPPTTPTPPATPAAPPTALVNTGPGSVIGIFAAATIGGAVLYRRLLARRLSRQ
jgi:hypothetical protein